MDPVCSKCGSAKVIPFASIMDQGEYSDGSLKAHVGFTNPEAWLFKGPVYARLQATICGECGYTELTVVNPAAIYQAYLAAQASR
jgi:hypothetical protein